MVTYPTLKKNLLAKDVELVENLLRLNYLTLSVEDVIAKFGQSKGKSTMSIVSRVFYLLNLIFFFHYYVQETHSILFF